MKKYSFWVASVSLAAASIVSNQTWADSTGQKTVTIDKDGTAHIHNATLPISSVLSPEAKAAVLRGQSTGGPRAVPLPKASDVAERRRQKDEALQPEVAHMRELYPVDVEAATIDGIPVSVFGQMKVVTIVHRQYPEHRFPAATEDFTKVYVALLKKYPPGNIGLVGCSAGGKLAAQSVASFQTAGLPAPGVLGIYCAGAGLNIEGDSATFATLGTSKQLEIEKGYFEGLNLDDPAISPHTSLSVLAKFPPTLFATGTRDNMMSSAAYSHRRLLQAGVETDLLIYDGLGHGFMTNPDLPESRELYVIAAKFYDRYLGR